jgi:hypothetical protein
MLPTGCNNATCILQLCEHLLEVCHGVIPELNEPIPQAEGSSLVALKVIKLVTCTCQSVLHMAHNALRDAQDIVLAVGVCRAVADSMVSTSLQA